MIKWLKNLNWNIFIILFIVLCIGTVISYGIYYHYDRVKAREMIMENCDKTDMFVINSDSTYGLVYDCGEK